MDKAYTLTVYTAAPGTPLQLSSDKNATSTAGHMYYEVSDGVSPSRSFGFAPSEHGVIRGPGDVVRDDAANYKDPFYSRTMQVTKEQYDKLVEFGQAPDKHGFNKYYDGITNSCIDYTWGALNHAGLHRRPFIVPDKDFEGHLRVLDNIDEIRSIKAPLPDSKLNTENYNLMPDRSFKQWLLTEESQQGPGRGESLVTSDAATSPRHSLHEQADTLVKQMDRDMGRESDRYSDCMAASVACLAGENGFDRIDHVVLSKATADKGAGDTVFVVKGDLEDPAHLRARMPTQKAVNTPVEESVQELARLESVKQQEAQSREQSEAINREQQAAPTRGMA